jgi:hypothetical protein
MRENPREKNPPKANASKAHERLGSSPSSILCGDLHQFCPKMPRSQQPISPRCKERASDNRHRHRIMMQEKISGLHAQSWSPFFRLLLLLLFLSCSVGRRRKRQSDLVRTGKTRIRSG